MAALPPLVALLAPSLLEEPSLSHLSAHVEQTLEFLHFYRLSLSLAFGKLSDLLDVLNQAIFLFEFGAGDLEIFWLRHTVVLDEHRVFESKVSGPSPNPGFGLVCHPDPLDRRRFVVQLEAARRLEPLVVLFVPHEGALLAPREDIAHDVFTLVVGILFLFSAKAAQYRTPIGLALLGRVPNLTGGPFIAGRPLLIGRLTLDHGHFCIGSSLAIRDDLLVSVLKVQREAVRAASKSLQEPPRLQIPHAKFIRTPRVQHLASSSIDNELAADLCCVAFLSKDPDALQESHETAPILLVAFKVCSHDNVQLPARVFNLVQNFLAHHNAVHALDPDGHMNVFFVGLLLDELASLWISLPVIRKLPLPAHVLSQLFLPLLPPRLELRLQVRLVVAHTHGVVQKDKDGVLAYLLGLEACREPVVVCCLGFPFDLFLPLRVEVRLFGDDGRVEQPGGRSHYCGEVRH